MDPQPFITVRCPACGSADARAQGDGRFVCTHCQSNFLYTGQANRAPQPGPVVVRRANPAVPITIAAVVLCSTAGVAFTVFFAAEASLPAIPVSPVATRAVTPTSPPPMVATAPRPVVAPTPVVVPPVVPTTEPEPEPDAPPAALALSDYQRLRGCECAPKGGKPITMHARPEGSTTSITERGVEVERTFAFVLAHDDKDFFALPTTDDTAPAARFVANEVSIGVGCAGDTVVVAAGDRVTAWSMTSHTALWSRSLPAPYGTFALGPGSDVVLDCERLRVSKGAVAVKAGRNTSRFSLADGSD